jgi:hypothetical protein
MATHIGSLDIGLVVGFFGGMRAFFRGFKAYRESRFLQDTPETPIRSIAMGFVRIHGKAKSDKLVTSPVSHTPCCYYIVEIAKWEKSQQSRTDSDWEDHDRGTWSHHGAEADGEWFYLEDATGRVLVDPHGAEYELETTGTRTVDSLTASSIATGGASERELLAYVGRVGLTPQIPGLRHGLGQAGMGLILTKDGKRRTPSEMMQGLLPQMAQMQARMQQGLDDEGPQSDPRVEEVRLAMIELNKLPFWDPKYDELRRRVVKMQERNKKLGLHATVAQPPSIPLSGNVEPPVAHPPDAAPQVASDSPYSSDQPEASGRYLLTECCIVPDREYDISGTCVENPEAKNESDRNLIRKGKNEPTYLISAMTAPAVNAMMGMRSTVMIYGGGMLAVFCLGLLLLRFGFI